MCCGASCAGRCGMGGTSACASRFLAKLVPVLGETMGEIFPEVIGQAAAVQTTLTQEEESFFRTLERGIELFEAVYHQSANKFKVEVERVSI